MEVIKAPDPRLRVQTKPVKKINNALLVTLKEMVKTTKAFKDPEGVGLASTQIGLTESFFIAQDDSDKKMKKFIMVINPKIISSSKKLKSYFEGCLSVPGTWGEVNRHLSLKVSYMDETGQKITKNLKGMLAWIFQHEIDHLNGVLFSDRVLQQKGRFYKYTGKDRAGSDTYEEITI